jgi:hypothetical protein
MVNFVESPTATFNVPVHERCFRDAISLSKSASGPIPLELVSE